MIGLDTNVLVRYYVQAAPGLDDEATFKQCEAARKLIDSGKRLMVGKTVVLELNGFCAAATSSLSKSSSRCLNTCWAWPMSRRKTELRFNLPSPH